MKQTKQQNCLMDFLFGLLVSFVIVIRVVFQLNGV